MGWEQEYFLVDEELYSARPDLSLTERTLLGHESAKNQQLDGNLPDPAALESGGVLGKQCPDFCQFVIPCTQR